MHASASTAVIESNDLNLKYPTLVDTIYQNHPEHRFWQDKLLRNELEKQIVLLVLADLDDGLSATYLALQKSAERHEWLRYEYLASDLLLFYIAYTEQVAIKGNSWLFGSGIKNNISAPSNGAINTFFNAPSYLERLNQLQGLSAVSPQHSRLYKKLLELSLDENISVEKFTDFAKEGEELEQKSLLLLRLQMAGDLSAEMKIYFESEGKKLYSRELIDIVIAFQKRHGLKADGIIGKKTRYWLNISPQMRIKLIALNTLRLQLWPINKSQTVLVNIPGYNMAYWEDGEKRFESKVIVGRKDRKTELFSTRLDSIVFNPTWNVPASIMRKDILPKALVNNDYFSQHHYEILQNWQSKK
jgi:murein L,D-transpeptidase YcbB/YkuD